MEDRASDTVLDYKLNHGTKRHFSPQDSYICSSTNSEVRYLIAVLVTSTSSFTMYDTYDLGCYQLAMKLRYENF